VGLTTLPPSISRLSRQCGILNISQPYRPPRPVNEDSFTFTTIVTSIAFWADVKLYLVYFFPSVWMVHPRRQRTLLQLWMALRCIQATRHLTLPLRRHTVAQVSRLHSLRVGLSHPQQRLEQDSIHLLPMDKQDIHNSLKHRQATREGSTLLQGPSNHRQPTASHHIINSIPSPVIPTMPTIRIGAILKQGMGVITRDGVTIIITKLGSVCLSVHVCAECFINIQLKFF
jgi:hypothetical protein